MILFLLTACGVDWGFGGQDMGDYDTGIEIASDWGALDEGVPGTVVPVVDLEATCDGEAGTLEQTLEVSADDGAIAVAHDGVDGSCCALWIPTAWTSGSDVEIVYSNVGQALPCECRCEWSFSFTVRDVPAGTWTVVAGDTTAEVTLE